jgi:hypothetical protein
LQEECLASGSLQFINGRNIGEPARVACSNEQAEALDASGIQAGMHQVDAPPSEDPSSSILEALNGTSELNSKQREQTHCVCLHKSENSRNNEDYCSETPREGVRNDNAHPFETKDIPVIEHDRGHEIDTEENEHVDMFIPQQHAIDDKIDADEDERVDAFTLHRHVMDDTRTLKKRNPWNVEEPCSSTENISNQ